MSIQNASAPVRALWNVWTAARGGAMTPLKRDFDPSLIAGHLANVWMYRFDPPGDDFVCLLAGERINEAWGASLRGRTLREIVGDADHPGCLGRWRSIIGTPQIKYAVGRRPRGPGVSRAQAAETRAEVERIVLPLASSSGAVDHILGMSLYSCSLELQALDPPEWADPTWIRCVDLPAGGAPTLLT
ncbi:MAG: PAS domain-containing protein [Alphaproteobacteria bacterium]|nr:PAS domain-containing protein [Alphaproteobacteria bacterium]